MLEDLHFQVFLPVAHTTGQFRSSDKYEKLDRFS